VKWINYNLRKAKVNRVVNNLGKDLQDSEALLHVLHRLDRKKCPIDVLKQKDMSFRALTLVDNALIIGVPNVITSYDILAANAKINTLFCSCIFNTNHGIKPISLNENEPAKMIDFGSGNEEM
jgi:plastin-1